MSSNKQSSNSTTKSHLSFFYHFLDEDEIAKIFVEKGADINVVNNEGRTPLMFAVINALSRNIFANLLLKKNDSIQLIH